MATQAITSPYWVGNMGHMQRWELGGPEFPYVKETASQAYANDDLLYFDTNGTIAICTVDGGTPTLLNVGIAGQASKAATGTTGASVLLFPIRSSDLFIGNVHHETVGSAITALTDLAPATRTRAICKSSTVPTGAPAGTTWRVSKDAAAEGAADATGHVTIVGFPLRSRVGGVLSAIGDTYGLVLFRFNDWSLASDGNPNVRVLQLSS